MPSYNEFTSSLFTMEPTAPAAALAPRPVTHQGAQHPLAEAQPGERSASAEATIDLDSLNPAYRFQNPATVYVLRDELHPHTAQRAHPTKRLCDPPQERQFDQRDLLYLHNADIFPQPS